MSRDDSGPSQWDETTPPYQVVRHFVRDDFEDADIVNFLRQHSIKTLEELPRKFILLVDVLQNQDNLADIFDAMRVALDKNRKTLEQVLGGQLLFDRSCFEADSFPYVEDAVSVHSETMPERGNEFTLVLGPSGSGKTYFAIWWLTDQLFRRAPKSMVLTIHFQAEKVVRLLRQGVVSTFPQAVVWFVEQQIKLALGRHRVVKNDKLVQLYLHFIIDDAGGEPFKKYFKRCSQIMSILEAVKTHMRFKFAERIHLTVVGCGLETDTVIDTSVIDFTKYYMQPWTEDHFHSLVDKTTPQVDTRIHVKQVVRAYPVLLSLISNARCATCLFNEIKDKPFPLQGSYTEESVNHVVAKVAQLYIASTGLKNVTMTADRHAIANAVFQAVDMALSKPSVAFFPRFNDLATKEMRSAALSLMDVNVQKTSGRTGFIDQDLVSASISPAVATVLGTLLAQPKQH